MLSSVLQQKSQHKTNRCVSTVLKPLRIFQFFMVLLLFAFMIYVIVMDPTPVSALACIIIIVLSGVYVFVLAVELISHFAGGALHIIPMVVFSLLGLFFFGVAGILLICTGYTRLDSQIVIVVLCVLTALFFLIDITMVLAFWKRRCSVCKRCCYSDGELLLPKDESRMDDTYMAVTRLDTMTSVSDVRVSAEDIPDHFYRKVQHPRRRQYVDCPTCVPSLCNLDVAQIQTDTKKTSVVESQTPKTVTKETPIQTLSKCEFCERQMQPFASPIGGAPPVQCLQHSPQWTPAIVQFVRGGVSIPCCPGCKCMTRGTQQHQSQQVVPEHRTKWVSQMLQPKTSEATQQVARSVHRVVSDDSTPRITGFAETVVKLTLAKADVKSKKKTDASGTLALTQNTMKTDARSIFKEDTKDIITRFSKDGKSKSKLSVGSAEKSSSVSGEEATPVQKKTCTDGKLLADSKYTTREKSIKKYNNVKRSKGGGEGDRIYQRFTRTMFREDTTDVEELLGRSVTTQVSPKLIMSPSSRTKPKTSLHLKTNKVDPVDDANISEENRVSEEVTSGITHATGTVQEIELAESSDPVEQQNACRCESRKSSKSASNNSKRYVTLFMSNLRDTYYCEFCRPYKCSESISKSFDIAELKKLRCASCKFSFYERCSDVCSICLKQRKRATPSFK